MKKEILEALRASEQLIREKIYFCETRLEENYKLLQGLDNEEEIKEKTEERIEFYMDLVLKYGKHLKAIKDFIDENKH